MILVSIFINTATVALVVSMHYECLHRLWKYLPKLTMQPKYRVLVGVFGTLIVHCIEIWIFAVVYYFMLQSSKFGHFEGNFEIGLFDCVYYSFTSYTTLGFGDIAPIGLLRFTTGIEALTGLVLITWTASFLYLEMQRYWQDEL